MHKLNLFISNFRQASRITLFSLIGLSISLAIFTLLAIYIYSEYTFDHSNKNSDHIYLLESLEHDRNLKHPFLPNPLGEYLQNELPELKKHCTLKQWGAQYSKKNEPHQTHNLDLYSVDSTFTQFFTVDIIMGNPTPLAKKNTIILSESTAKRIFGDTNPIGQVLERNFKEDVTVTAVYKDLPVNNSFHKLDGFCSFITYEWVNDWSEWSFITFFDITEGIEADALEDKINELEQVKESRYDSKGNPVRTLHLTPLSDLHFDSVIGGGNKKLVTTLLVIAILLIVMAFFNHLNFSLAGLPKKAKAISLRKISGARNLDIFILNFVDIAFLITLAFLLSIVITHSILASYPNLYGYEISLSDNKVLIALIYFLSLIMGAFISFIPSRILMVTQHVSALKGTLPFSVKSGKTKYTLPIIQYVVAIILITGVVLINKQIVFIKDYELGFKKENILVLNVSPNIAKQEKAFVDELMKNPAISDYAFSQFVPGGVGMSWGREVDGNNVNFKAWPVDERYLDFMGFEIVKGRSFSSNIKADENTFIFNQTAVKTFGWEENFLGKTIPGMGFTGKIIGVIKDMKYASLYEEVQPMCFWLTPTRHDKLSLRISGNNVSQTIAHIKDVYTHFEKRRPIHYSFLDEALDQQYKQIEKQAELISFACIVALLIAVIGTLGMAIFTCEYRIKEVGIRKTNGASTYEILNLLNRPFLKQVIIAFVIASPIAWYTMQNWLKGFAYQTEISWWIFALAGLSTFFIALLTVSWQTYKAATQNPVKALRYE